ncbi:hypothetical protein RQM65_04095 [Pricia sp. S334]|uniref:DUF4025 domain-containing protein n=1 Tax=Pricia mediterranea TaxID=3076079 RepID=A0ABU3L297_9FLAO|nr:hypothetical protein [Pricia sp. S334]MDT7827842.1 hypothetical protein [Pricia sp. S334]
MGNTDDKRKFKRKTDQDHPTSANIKNTVDTNKFDIDEETIKDQENKK